MERRQGHTHTRTRPVPSKRVASATTTANIVFDPQLVPISLVALSVVTTAPSSVVYSVGCLKSAVRDSKDESTCFMLGVTDQYITIAPSSFGYSFSAAAPEISYTGGNTSKCRLSDVTSALCTWTSSSIGRDGSSTTGSSSGTGILVAGIAKVTAEVAKLQGVATPTVALTTGTASASHSTMSSVTIGTQTTGTQVPDTKSTGESSSASTSTAGVPQPTRAVGGLAAAIVVAVGALML